MGFANGFNSGVSMVSKALDSREEARRRKAQEERQAKMDARADEEYNYGLQQRKKVDDAIGGYQALQRGVVTGEADWGGMPAQSDLGPTQGPLPEPTAVGGGALKTRAATQGENVAARTAIALAQRDVKALGGLEAESKEANWNDNFARLMKEYQGSEAQVAPALQHINGTSSRITMTDPDPKTGVVRATVVKADQRAEYMKLSRADQAKLYAANQMMEQDPQRALQIIGSVNKTLAEAAALDAGLELQVLGKNEISRHHGAVETRQAQQLEEQKRHAMVVEGQGDTRLKHDAARLGLEAQRVAIARASAGGSGGGKASATDKMMEQVNAYAAIIQKADPSVTPEQAQRRAATAIMAKGRDDKPDLLQTELTKNYAAEASQARTPAQLIEVQNRFRTAGLQSLGENPLIAALKAAQKPGAGDSPGKSPTAPAATPKTAIQPKAKPPTEDVNKRLQPSMPDVGGALRRAFPVDEDLRRRLNEGL